MKTARLQRPPCRPTLIGLDVASPLKVEKRLISTSLFQRISNLTRGNKSQYQSCKAKFTPR